MSLVCISASLLLHLALSASRTIALNAAGIITLDIDLHTRCPHTVRSNVLDNSLREGGIDARTHSIFLGSQSCLQSFVEGGAQRPTSASARCAQKKFTHAARQRRRFAAHALTLLIRSDRVSTQARLSSSFALAAGQEAPGSPAQPYVPPTCYISRTELQGQRIGR